MFVSYRKIYVAQLLAFFVVVISFSNLAIADSGIDSSVVDGVRPITGEAQRVLKDAEAGDVHAQFALAVMYQQGTMVPRSDIDSVKWFKKAADQGDAQAQFMMGNAYVRGRGTICDDEEAVKSYQKAADQGSAEGHFGLAMEYHFRHGVTQNDAEAYFWLSLSAQQNTNAVPKLQLVRKKLSAQQLDEIKERVKQWKITHKS